MVTGDEGTLGANGDMVGVREGMLGAEEGMLDAEEGMLGAEEGMLGAEEGMLGDGEGMVGADEGMVAAELAELRRRAYGPDADIADDPAALARLRALEAAARPLPPSMPSLPPSMPSAPPTMPSTAPTTRPPTNGETSSHRRDPGITPGSRRGEPVSRSAGGEREQEAGGERMPRIAPVRAVGDAEPAERRLSRRVRAAWAASVVATAAVSAGLAVWVFPFGARDDAQHTARLTPQPGEVPEGIGWRTDDDETLRPFGTYEGIAVYADTECVYAQFLATGTTTDTTESSYTFGGCSGTGIVPLMDVYLPPAEDADSYYQGVDYPAQLRERFPEGAMLRFALRSEGEIVVDVGELPALYFG